MSSWKDRQARISREMEVSRKLQSVMVEGARSAHDIENDWGFKNVCPCHSWFPDSRCHILQEENAKRRSR